MTYTEQLQHVAAPNNLQPLTANNGDTGHRLADALATLPEDQRMVLSLLHNDYLNIVEIAAVLDLSCRDVLNLRASAMASIRSLLAS